jgi:hypothetical protein
LQGSRLLILFPGSAAVLLACSLPAVAEPDWISPEAIRAEFVGKKMQGHFFNGETWTASHHEDSRFEMCQGALCVEGRWLFRGRAFCIVSGPPY